MVKKQTRWSRNFNERAYNRLAVTIPKGRKETVEQYAKAKGLSVNGLVNELLADAIGITMDEWKGKTDRTAVELASELGVSPETIKQSYRYSKGIDAISAASPEIADDILSGKLEVPKAAILAIGKEHEEY